MYIEDSRSPKSGHAGSEKNDSHLSKSKTFTECPSSVSKSTVIRRADSFPMSEERFQKRVLHLLCEIKDEVARCGVRTGTSYECLIEQCCSLDNLRELELSLKDMDTRRELIAKCVRVGGNTAKDMVKNIMSRLMTDEVMAFFNMSGQRSGKFAFRETTILKVVTASTMNVHKDTEENIIKLVGDLLRYAPARMQTTRR